ncbi:septum site-determining protein MinC [Clostridium sp. LY3-2]|uniref:septum site-determining protein MinC n=1 Tax=Clostridium sp. LY3-2 TaxID=2942482 RepID=UPI0021536C7E|nr:septum site-determining protein MinC [Clostridium sp. LY3-2]MCR6514198.1 septum site-determining protein MinC [Clostridium sp. LY3-2]
MDKKIIVKGTKNGLNVEINMNKFSGYDEMLSELIEKLSKGKSFYKGSTIKLIFDITSISQRSLKELQEVLLKYLEFGAVELPENEAKEEKEMKIFSGVYEGRTKFIRKTVRGGQCISYDGNIVIIGDINSGSEVTAAGNIIVLGSVKGSVSAGISGNSKAIIAAFSLQPEVLKIGDKMALSPDSEKPMYPEVAKIKNGMIIVEPYLPNKYIY